MLKKVLLIVVCFILAQVDYMLVQKFSGLPFKFYDITSIGLTDWTTKSMALALILGFSMWLLVDKYLPHVAISLTFSVALATFIAPLFVAMVHVTFFRKGPWSSWGENFFKMLSNVTFTRWGILAHFIIALILALIAFIYVFYFQTQAKETKSKNETAPDLGTNEDG